MVGHFEKPEGIGTSNTIGGLMGTKLMLQVEALMKIIFPSVVTP